MSTDMITVGMADENSFGSGMPLAGIEPKIQFRQMNAAAIVPEGQSRHAGDFISIGRQDRKAISDTGLAGMALRRSRLWELRRGN
jgi:hypothetical protein